MDHDPNHLWGPFRRSDIISIVCFSLAIYLGVKEKHWESIAFVLLVAGAIVAGLSPRFQGHIGLKIGNVLQLGATFAKPALPPRVQSSEPVRVRRKPKPELLPAPAPDQAHPQSQVEERAED
jgi:hypothetical protein